MSLYDSVPVHLYLHALYLITTCRSMDLQPLVSDTLIKHTILLVIRAGVYAMTNGYKGERKIVTNYSSIGVPYSRRQFSAPTGIASQIRFCQLPDRVTSLLRGLSHDLAFKSFAHSATNSTKVSAPQNIA
jgi:hypothetical protein